MADLYSLASAATAGLFIRHLLRHSLDLVMRCLFIFHIVEGVDQVYDSIEPLDHKFGLVLEAKNELGNC